MEVSLCRLDSHKCFFLSPISSLSIFINVPSYYIPAIGSFLLQGFQTAEHVTECIRKPSLQKCSFLMKTKTVSVRPYPQKRNHTGFVNISPTLVIDTSMERSSREPQHGEPIKVIFLRKCLP